VERIRNRIEVFALFLGCMEGIENFVGVGDCCGEDDERSVAELTEGAGLLERLVESVVLGEDR